MGGPGSGRPIKLNIEGIESRDTRTIIKAAAPHAAKYFLDIVLQRVKKPSWARIRVCEFIIEQEVGKARQRTELTGADGAPLNWQQLNILAEKAEVLILEQAKTEGILPEEVRTRVLAEQAEKPPYEGQVSRAAAPEAEDSKDP
jgi:hypothetical protein